MGLVEGSCSILQIDAMMRRSNRVLVQSLELRVFPLRQHSQNDELSES